VLPQSTPRLAAGASPDLEQEIAFLKRLASAGAEGLVVADTHGRCVFVNDLADRLVGSAAAQDGLAISAYLSSLFQRHRVMAESGSAVVDTPDIAALAASGRWLRFTSPTQGAAFPKGERQYALVPYSLKNERGVLIGYALFIRDITPLIQDESLGNGLLSSVSHDLRTPLMVIKAAVTGLLQEGLQWDETLRRETLQDINEETDRLTSLVSALLEMSHIQGGVLQLQTEWCDLAEIIHTVLDRLQKVTGHHRMVYDVAASLPLIQGDFMQLDRVLCNLIENAVKYSPGGSEVRVMARLEGTEVQVSVLDQGRGVPAEARERIFEKFYRVKQQGGCPKRSASLNGLNHGLGEAHTPPLAGGLGLGLAICRGIILAHHGRIWVEARPEGGSRFAFALPVEQAAPITGRVARDSGPFLEGAKPPTTSEQAELLDIIAADGWEEQEETAGAD
jgi:signal transduction histidine kinase